MHSKAALGPALVQDLLFRQLRQHPSCGGSQTNSFSSGKHQCRAAGRMLITLREQMEETWTGSAAERERRPSAGYCVADPEVFSQGSSLRCGAVGYWNGGRM